MNIFRLTLGVAVVLTACANNETDSEPVGNEGAAASGTVYLGMGYDSERFQNKDSRARVQERIERQPYANVNFKKIDGWSTIKRDMGFFRGGELRIRTGEIFSQGGVHPKSRRHRIKEHVSAACRRLLMKQRSA